MSWFSKKYFPEVTYKDPERLDPTEARQRRLFAELARQRRALEVQPARLSPGNKFHLNQLKEFQSKFGAELEARRRRVEHLQKQSRRNPSFGGRLLKAAISEFLQLHQKQSILLQRAKDERRNASYQPVGADRRMFNFDPANAFPRTPFGTHAWTRLEGADAVTARVFRNPALALPCIQRAVRKEVMFAKRQAGKGHKGRRRRSVFSTIWC